MDSAIISAKYDMVNISFSKPFVYAPSGEQFSTQVVNEDFGYVPQTLIEWIAQHPDYISKFPGIVSCLPGGPSIDFNTDGSQPEVVLPFIAVQSGAPELTVSSTVTIVGIGCFHPGACPTPAALGAMVSATTLAVTSEAQAQDSMFNLCHLSQGNHSY